MTTTARIVCWHPVLTEHQAHTLRALAAASGRAVTVIVGRSEDPTRKAQGWTAAATDGLSVRNLDGAPPSEDLRLLQEHRNDIHVFGSPFDQPRQMRALFRATSMGLRVYLISEPYSPITAGYLHDRHRLRTWLKSRLRPWVYRCYGAWLKRRVEGVFAISPLAVAQYRRSGIAAERIFPFGYFVPRAPASDAPAAPRVPGTCRAIFVGNLIATKGLHELSVAARKLRAEGVDLLVDAYGSGDPSAFDFDGVSIRHAGRIPFGQAQAAIAAYDFLVLPSRYDGWGVVINEAILAGVPVVCSDRVGAGAFVRQWGCGLIAASGSVDALADAMRRMCTEPALRRRMADACRSARDRLEPAVAGRYMADVMLREDRTGPRPPNPWYDPGQDGLP
jgi:glycosyltransferase involved in cell wall biosynthesis